MVACRKKVQEPKDLKEEWEALGMAEALKYCGPGWTSQHMGYSGWTIAIEKMKWLSGCDCIFCRTEEVFNRLEGL